MSDICSVLAYGLLQLRGLARWQVHHSIAVHTNPKRKISGGLPGSADLGLGEPTSQTARRKSFKILTVYLALYDYIITLTHTHTPKSQLKHNRLHFSAYPEFYLHKAVTFEGSQTNVQLCMFLVHIKLNLLATHNLLPFNYLWTQNSRQGHSPLHLNRQIVNISCQFI